MKPNIGISDEHALQVSNILNTLLADEFVLYTKTRNYHWNVTGPGFSELHKFFEGQYSELEEMIDEIAERARTIGHYALGSLNAFLKATRLTEGQDESSSAKMIQNLLDDHETIIRLLRNEIETVTNKYNVAGIADFITGIMEAHEKMAWMLRSHLS